MKLSERLNQLKLGKHHRMERFALVFTVLSVCMLLVVSTAFAKNVVTQDRNIENTPLYTKSFVTSKTQVQGDVLETYVSEDKTKAFVLLKFDNIKKVSTNAENYQMFLTGANVIGNRQNLISEPSGSIYLFDDSGYMGILLVNKLGFQSQILDLVIRGNAELVPDMKRGDMTETNDESFVKHDQFRIYFNPGAKEAKTISALNQEAAPKYDDLYNQTVIATQEEELREKLTAEIETLSTNLNQIIEFTERASDNKGIQIPNLPDAIAGDVILEEMDGEEPYFKLSSGKVVAGGFEFDWYPGSIEEGYLDNLVSKSGANSYDEFFAQKAKEPKIEPDDMSYDKEWRLKDGTLIADLNDGSATGRYQDLTETINDLTKSWQTYYTTKARYQKELLGQLLKLEYDAKQISDRSSANTSEEVLVCY